MKTITLRLLDPVELPDSWIELHELTCVRNAPHRRFPGARFVEVSPIPEGYEVCDLEGATKALIGGTWCDCIDVNYGRAVQIGGSKVVLFEYLEALGVLAIRPIPEPEPLKGEAKVVPFSGTEPSCYGWARIPNELIGRRVRWEVIKEGGE